MLEELKKYPYKDKKFRHLALEVIALKVVRLLITWSAYATFFIFLGFILQGVLHLSQAVIISVCLVIITFLMIYWTINILYSFRRSQVSHFVVTFFYQVVSYKIFKQAAIDQDLYNLLQGSIIPVMITLMILYVIVKKAFPILEKRYLFKKVINRKYLSLEKDTILTAYDDDFYQDMWIGDVNLRMQVINDRLIKTSYQDFVELSFINEQIHSAQAYSANTSEKKFTEGYHEYLLFFCIYPFTKQVDLRIPFARIKLTNEDKKIIVGERKI